MMNTSMLNVTAAIEGVATMARDSLPGYYLSTAHRRISIFEGLMLHAMQTDSLTAERNRMLVAAREQGAFTTLLAFNVPGCLFTNDTYSMHAEAATAPLYTTYCAYVDDPTGTLRPGDPKRVNVPGIVLEELLHFFYSLSFISASLSDGLSFNLPRSEFVGQRKLEYVALAGRIRAARERRPGELSETYLDILQEDNPANVYWNPFFVENLNGSHCGNVKRFWLFINAKMVAEYPGAVKHIQVMVNNMVFASAKERIALANRLPNTIRDIQSIQTKKPNVSPAVALAAEYTSLTPDHTTALIVQVSKTLRDWELTAMRAYTSGENTASFALLKQRNLALRLGDNIRLGPFRVPALPVGRRRPVVRDEDDGAADFAQAGGVDVSSRDPRPPAAAMMRLDDIESKIQKPALYDSIYYIPATDITPYGNAPQEPVESNDPRSVEAQFNPLMSFSDWVSTDMRLEQVNPFCYFAFSPDEQLETVSPFNIGAPEHSPWQSKLSTIPNVSYGALIAQIPTVYNLGYGHLIHIFKGFPPLKYMAPSKKELMLPVLDSPGDYNPHGHVSLILPSTMPSDLPLLPLSEMVTSCRMFSDTHDILKRMVRESDNPDYTAFLEVLRREDPQRLASFYMTMFTSLGMINNDGREMESTLGNWVDIAMEKVVSAAKDTDILADIASTPESSSTLSNNYNHIAEVLNARRLCAMHCIMHTNALATHVGYETNQPTTRQPGDLDTAEKKYDNLDDAVKPFLLGMDVIHSTHDSGIEFTEVAKEMCTLSSATLSKLQPKPDDVELAASLERWTKLCSVVSHVSRRSTDMISYDRMQEEPEILSNRTATLAVLDAGIHCINTKTFLRICAVPNNDNKKYGFRPLHGVKFVYKRVAPPVAWMPMSAPMSMMCLALNKRGISARWAPTETMLYTNTSPFGEMWSHLANYLTGRKNLRAHVDLACLFFVAACSGSAVADGRNGARLNIIVTGDTGTSKSYIITCIDSLLPAGIAIHGNSESSKLATANVNYNGFVGIAEELPTYLISRQGNHAEADPRIDTWKECLDSGYRNYQFLRTDSEVHIRKRLSSVSWFSGVYLWSTNHPIENMQQPLQARFLVVIATAPLSGASAAITGNTPADMALHGIGNEGGGGKFQEMYQVIYTYVSMALTYFRVAPEYGPDITDGCALVGEILRNMKRYIPRDVSETRRNGKVNGILAILTIINGIYTGIRHDMVDPNSRTAPTIEGGRVLTHLSVQEVLNRSIPHMYCTTEMVVFALSTLHRTLENVVRTQLLQYFARRVYQDGSLRRVQWKEALVDDTGRYVNGSRGGNGGGTANGKITSAKDYNFVVLTIHANGWHELATLLAKNASPTEVFSKEHVIGALKVIQSEIVDIAAVNCANKARRPVDMPNHVIPPPLPSKKRKSAASGTDTPNRDPRQDTAAEKIEAEIQEIEYWREARTVPPLERDAHVQMCTINQERKTFELCFPHHALSEHYIQISAEELKENYLEQSPTYKAVRDTLQTKALQRYPDWVHDHICQSIESEDVRRRFSDKFGTGQARIQTAFVSAIGYISRSTLTRRQAELKAVLEAAHVWDPMYIIPTPPPLWLPEMTFTRDITKAAAFPTIMPSTEIDAQFSGADQHGANGTAGLFNYEYDLDYTAYLRRCQRLNLDPKRFITGIPAIQQAIKMAYAPNSDSEYPSASIKQYVDISAKTLEAIARGDARSKPRPPPRRAIFMPDDSESASQADSFMSDAESERSQARPVFNAKKRKALKKSKAPPAKRPKRATVVTTNSDCDSEAMSQDISDDGSMSQDLSGRWR